MGDVMALYEIHWLNSAGRAIALHTADCQDDAEAHAFVRRLVQYSSHRQCVLYCGTRRVPLDSVPAVNEPIGR
jgi:hypothetical protein